MFEYTLAEYSLQTDAQPLVLQLWLNWLLFVNIIPSLFFLRHPQARYVLLAVVVMLAFNVPLALTFGFGKVLALPHIIVWVPLVLYLLRQWRARQIADLPLLKAWLLAVIGTNVISLVFDIRDAFLFIAGDRSIIKADVSDIPYLSFAVIALALIGIVIYLRKSENA